MLDCEVVAPFSGAGAATKKTGIYSEVLGSFGGAK